MRRNFIHVVAVLLVSFALGSGAADESAAQQLATDVWKASGGAAWAGVQQIRFTFVVEQDGQTLASAQHEWNVAAQTDHVKWKDKDVTVNLAAPAQDEEGKAGYARWVNDSYWLLAPLKLHDPGVKLQAGERKEVDGGSFDTLRVSFEQVGLTPNDEYVLYIDPQSKLVRAWDYIPKGDTTMHGSWDSYQNFGGLNLSTEHKFGGKTIKFTGIEVVAHR